MLRSLDAIHLATAHELRAELTAFVCYDKRLGDSAQALGLLVEAPALPDSWRPVTGRGLKIFTFNNGAAANARVGGDFCHERAT